MSIFARAFAIALVASTIIVGLGSCGTTSNNDQGTSFAAFGWFVLDEDEIVGISGSVVALGSDRPSIPTVTSHGTSGPVGPVLLGDGQVFFVLMGLENRMTTQFIRVDRVDCRYEVQGSSPGFTIPNDSSNTSFILGPLEVDDEGVIQDPVGSDESPALPQIVYLGVDILSTDTLSYLNVNRNSLPVPPFNLTVTCTAVGVTQAGDILTTNPLNFNVTMTDAAECCTGTGAEGAGGFQEGTGSGGDFSSTGDDEEETE